MSERPSAGEVEPRLRELLRRGTVAAPWRSTVVALLAPTVATGLALVLPHGGTATAESVYLLAVVLAGATGGLWGGLGAALLSFVGLNYFFFPPRHSLAVAGVEGVVSLVVFLLVATLVGGLFARVVRERSRSEQREHEARVLSQLSATLLSSGPLEQTLARFAARLTGLLELSSCRIEAEGLVGPIAAGEGSGPGGVAAAIDSPSDTSASGGSRVLATLPLTTRSGTFGELTVERAAGEPAFGDIERSLLGAVATQLALILETKRLDDTVRETRLEAEASQLRAALFSSVTHDLRTPLASIKASVTSLQDAAAVFDAEQRSELLQTILEETDRLNRMVGNLLDLARFRASSLTPQQEPTEMDELIGSVLHRLAGMLQPFSVRVVISQELPSIPVDPLQIDQVLTNVLENAARFSPPAAEITISARASESVLQVRVTDRGPGIAVDERERVFEEFYRRDAGRGRAGTGLGLAIARAIVVAHGGRIWIEGAPGGGTVVVFELPLNDEGADVAQSTGHDQAVGAALTAGTDEG